MTDREAMKQALEALEHSHAREPIWKTPIKDAITALRQALEQPTDEPVACIRALTEQCAALIQERDKLQKQVWRYEKSGVTCQTYGHRVESSCSECNVHEVYSSAQPAREWVGLTDEGALHLWAGDVPRPVMGKNKVLAFARAIEQALKEKNT
jgi:hypothetical protein